MSDIITNTNNLAMNIVETVGNNASNVLSTANDVANQTVNALNNSVGNTGTPWFWISVVVLLLAIVGVAFWKFGFFGTVASPRFPVPTETSLAPLKLQKEETWCFVGEDMTGRWCVRVPHRGACDAERSYSSKSDCQLTAASRMPLGINLEGGARVAPFLGPPPSAQPIG